MADAHHDPNSAPMHHDIVADYKPIHMFMCALLGLAAMGIGTVLGLILVNVVAGGIGNDIARLLAATPSGLV